jgi:hypothetical protein
MVPRTVLAYAICGFQNTKEKKMAADKDKKRKDEQKKRKAYQQRKNKPDKDGGEKKADGLIPISEPCPIGWMMVQIVDKETGTKGKCYWVDPATLKDDAKQRQKLTSDQIERIRAFRRVLAEHEIQTEERTFYDMSRESDPEQELVIWERIASAYETEMELRPEADADERDLLYGVLVTAANVGIDSKAVLSSLPRAKAFPHLEPVIDFRYPLPV